jgi:ATP/maltotriose-dependent transcriptional regulator MalT
VVALLLQSAVEMFNHSELITLLHWIRALPEEHMRTNPHLSIIAAWALLATGQQDAVEPHLQNIEHVLGVIADGSEASLALPAQVRGALGEVSCIRANLAFHQVNIPRVLELSLRAKSYLRDDVETGLFNSPRSLRTVLAFNIALTFEFSGDASAASQAFTEVIALCQEDENMHLMQLAGSHLAQLQVIQGKLRQAEQSYQQTLQSASKTARPSPYSGVARAGLGNILCEWNELDRASACLTQAIELGRPWASWETFLPSYLGLARIKTAQSELDQALALLEELANLFIQQKLPYGLSFIEANKAHLWIRQGNLEAAAHWAQSASSGFEGDISYMQEPEAIILARVLVGCGKLDEALQLATRLLTAAEAGKRWGRVIEVLVIQALALHAQGETESALETVARALALAEPEGYVRIFADEGEPMRLLLQRINALREGRTVRMKEYIGKLLAAFGKQAAHIKLQSSTLSPQPLEEPLSQRELEVLRLIAGGLTNQEIAERLVLSLNTVKTHVRNIHSKLNTRNRTEATIRARELGLL